MKCSLDISNFHEEIFSLSHSVIFLYFFALISEEGFLISPCYSLELCLQMLISYPPLSSRMVLLLFQKNSEKLFFIVSFRGKRKLMEQEESFIGRIFFFFDTWLTFEKGQGGNISFLIS